MVVIMYGNKDELNLVDWDASENLYKLDAMSLMI